jgi:hypothetical protein
LGFLTYEEAPKAAKLTSTVGTLSKAGVGEAKSPLTDSGPRAECAATVARDCALEVSTAMLRTLRSSLALLFAVTTAHQAAELPFVDDFTAPDLNARRALRGDWIVQDGVAKVTQDDALYAKFKDHGPILFYDIPHQDATIEFSFRPEGVKLFIFTVNGADGHIFRTVTSATGTGFRAFPPSDSHASISLHQSAKPLAQGEWTAMKIELKGPRATVLIGGGDPITVDHPSLDRPKTNISLGFSFGTLAVKNFSVR